MVSTAGSLSRLARAMQNVCAEAASFDLPADVLGACIHELQAAYEVALVKGQEQSTAVFAEGAHTKSALCGWRPVIIGLEPSRKQRGFIVARAAALVCIPRP